jgi:hypothetical protein
MTSLLAPPAPERDPERDPDRDSDAPKARSACVVVGATPAQVAAVADSDRVAIAANRLGSLVTGRLGSLPVDYAEAFAGPVYDILYNPTSGWFAVTVYRGVDSSPVRFDNRPGQDPGYPRIPDVLGATTPLDILAALDVPAAAISFAP